MMKRVLVYIVILLQGICLYAQDINRTPKASVELNMGYVPYKSWVNSRYVAFHNLSPTFSVYTGRLKFGAGFDWVNYYEYNSLVILSVPDFVLLPQRHGRGISTQG